MKRLFFICTMLFPVCSYSETGPLGFGEESMTREMETDRPDFTEGAQTVEPGHLQIEGGYTFTYDDEDTERATSHTVPELLLRAGVLSNVELRLDWSGYVREETTDKLLSESSIAEGATDMGLGLKHRIISQDGALPTLAYIFRLGIPVGSNEVSSDKVEPEFKAIWAYDLTDEGGIAGNFNFAAPHSDEERFFEFSFSISGGYSICDSFGTYVEYFGFYPEGGVEGEDDTHYLNSGLTWGLTENLQADVRIGFGLNSDADDLFTGAGLAWRL